MRQCIWLSGMAAVFLMGCDKADDRAMRTLYERDYTFKIGDYFRAAKDGDAKAVAAFLEFGMEPDVEDGYGQRSLLLAASEGREDVVRMLVAAGSEVDYVTPEGETPILAGAGSGSVHVLEVLLAAGANPAYRNPKGWGTLTKAAAAGDARSVEKLVAEVPAQRDEALLIAAMEGEVECIDVLLAHGAEINAISGDGNSPLMYSVKNGHEDAMELLLHHGAGVSLRNREGRRAVDLAIDPAMRKRLMEAVR